MSSCVQYVKMISSTFIYVPVCYVEVNHTLHIEKCDDGEVEPLTLTKMNKLNHFKIASTLVKLRVHFFLVLAIIFELYI